MNVSKRKMKTSIFIFHNCKRNTEKSPSYFLATYVHLNSLKKGFDLPMKNYFNIHVGVCLMTCLRLNWSDCLFNNQLTTLKLQSDLKSSSYVLSNFIFLHQYVLYYELRHYVVAQKCFWCLSCPYIHMTDEVRILTKFHGMILVS